MAEELEDALTIFVVGFAVGVFVGPIIWKAAFRAIDFWQFWRDRRNGVSVVRFPRPM